MAYIVGIGIAHILLLKEYTVHIPRKPPQLEDLSRNGSRAVIITFPMTPQCMRFGGKMLKPTPANETGGLGFLTMGKWG